MAMMAGPEAGILSSPWMRERNRTPKTVRQARADTRKIMTG